MKKELEFPRTYTTSSAAYRVIKHLKQKGDTRDFLMIKESVKVFVVTIKKTMTLDEFLESFKTINKGNVLYKYYIDGVHGNGYYELKTGDRRRPNSMFIPVNEVYDDQIN